MPTEKIEILQYRCLRCKHTWLPRKPSKPLLCPSCNSASWDHPRQREKKVEAIKQGFYEIIDNKTEEKEERGE